MDNKTEMIFDNDEPDIEIMDQEGDGYGDGPMYRLHGLPENRTVKEGIGGYKVEYVEFYLQCCRYIQRIESATSEPDKKD